MTPKQTPIRCWLTILAFALAIVGFSLTPTSAFAQNYCDFKGRIGYSADGNQHDPDDWAASALSVSQIWAAGLQDRLVHFDYNSHWGGGSHQNDSRKITEGYKSTVQVARKLGGFNTGVFYDAQQSIDNAAESIKRAVNASSADNPFTLIVAGPMHVPYQGLVRADKSKLKHVTVVSHSTWNNNHSHSTKTWSDIQSLGNGLAATRISDQNQRLGPGPISRFSWLQGINGDLNYVYNRLLSYNYLNDGSPTEEAQSRCGTNANGTPVFPNCTDVSDSGMTYYVLTGRGERWQGTQSATPSSIKQLITNPQNKCGSAPAPTTVPTSAPTSVATATPSAGSPANAGELIIIDAQGNRLRSLSNGASISRNSLPARYSIQYTPRSNSGGFVQVQFHRNGSVQYENSAPHTMYGRSGSQFATQAANVGSYSFRIKVYNGSSNTENFVINYQITGGGSSNPTATPAATVTPTPPSTSPTTAGRLAIINAQGNEIRLLTNGATIPRASLPARHTIQYTPQNSSGSFTQVQFHYSGNVQYEDNAPYSMFGRSGSQFATQPTNVGSYTLRIKVYGSNGSQEDFQVSYQITGGGSSPNPTATPAPTATSSPSSGNGSLIFINAQGNTIRTLSNGATIRRSDLPARYSIKYTPQNGSTSATQVQFHFNGSIQYENSAPYTLLGRSGSQFRTQPVQTGSYSLRIKVYDGATNSEDFRVSYQITD